MYFVRNNKNGYFFGNQDVCNIMQYESKTLKSSQHGIIILCMYYVYNFSLEYRF